MLYKRHRAGCPEHAVTYNSREIATCAQGASSFVALGNDFFGLGWWLCVFFFYCFFPQTLDGGRPARKQRQPAAWVGRRSRAVFDAAKTACGGARLRDAHQQFDHAGPPTEGFRGWVLAVADGRDGVF